jgi:hypothetical protein
MGSAVAQAPAVNIKSILTVSLLSLAYLLLSYYVVGFKSDQLVLIGIFNTLFYLSPITRKFILGFSIFIVYWIIFDYMKAIPNYKVSTVHIGDLYNFEKRLFGIHFNGQILTPNEYCRLNATTFLDILSGLFYICWIPVPLSFAAFLFFRNRRQFLGFALTFLTVNLLGFVVYYLYPAAPPWYVQYHGFTFHASTLANTGGLARFDSYFNVTIFKSIYAKGSNVFAAMPSLHSAYPVIVMYYGLKNRVGLINILLATVMIGIWLTAIYASQHYIVDVLAGIICAIAGINLFNLLSSKVGFIQSYLNKYEQVIR